MHNYIVVRSELSKFFYVYNCYGRLIDRVPSLADASLFFDKVKASYSYRSVTYSSTCCDDVIIVSFK